MLTNYFYLSVFALTHRHRNLFASHNLLIIKVLYFFAILIILKYLVNPLP